jgi:luciferase family oxidoreductase group 1
MDLALSILDQSTIISGSDAAQAIRETMEVAKLADRLGYARYWVAEHHNSRSHAGSAPEIIIAAVAATTQRIRVGSAGVMLPHYSALKVAEQFRALEAVAPGRIDLGLGRAPGSDGRTAYALNPNAAEASDNFPAAVRDLLGWLGDGLPERHPFREVRASPEVPTCPEVWILGSSDYGAQVAAFFGLPYCFAHFITDGRGCADALNIYRQTFQETRGRKAHAGIGIYALVADTEAEAERLFAPRALWRLHRERGVYSPLPSADEAASHPYTDADMVKIARMRSRAMIGSPEQVHARISALAEELDVQEVAILTPCHDPVARRRSVTLLARAFGLTGELVPCG